MPDQSAKIGHWTKTSSDSQFLTNHFRFSVGTGSAFASIAWIAVSIGFSWYAGNFGSYNKTYGSPAAIVVFMMWLWLSIVVILIGAELDAEMEHQTARDTATGGGKPMGRRGAEMADTVGRAED